MKAEGSTPRATRSAVRERIFRAAASLIAEVGPGATSARAICSRARITAPTLYRHFGDLNGLSHEVLTLMYLPEAQAHPGREYSDPVGMIEYMWDCCIGTAIRSPGLVDLKNQLLAAGEAPDAMKQFYSRLETSFEELARQRKLTVPPKIAASMYWAAAVGMARIIATSQHGWPGYSPLATDALREAVWCAIVGGDGEPAPAPRSDQPTDTAA